MTFFQVKLLVHQTFDTFESLAESVLVNGNEKQIFIVVYRAPQTSRVVFIEYTTYLELFHNTNVNIYICGDFNLEIDDVNDQYYKNLMDMMSTQQFLSRINEPSS